MVSDPTLYTFLFGPQFSFPAGKVKAYGRFLAGGSHRSLTESQTDTLNGQVLASALATSSASGNLFAMAFGGGVDYPVRKNIVACGRGLSDEHGNRAESYARCDWAGLAVR